ncbi:MAG: polysaccharide biosynthesis/export family protein [Planctomycetota bacterium]
MTRALGGVLVCLWLTGCASSVQPINERAVLAESDAKPATPARPPRLLTPPGRTDYRVGPRDVLEVQIYELEAPGELKKIKARVAQSGSIVLPLIGRVPAAGKTTAELQADIIARLEREFMVNPSAQVVVAKHEARSVTVLGAVKKPGKYHLAENSTSLIGALAVAGGLDEEAGSTVYLVRRGAPEALASAGVPALGTPREASTTGGGGPAPAPQRLLQIDLDPMMTLGDLSNNPTLADGDIVHVPPVSHFFVSGLVHDPGAFPLRDKATVLRAIAMAGGLKDEATPEVTVVIRKTPEGRVTIPVDLIKIEANSDRDLLLQADDVVLVSENGASRALRGVGDLFRGFFTVGYQL